MTLSYAKVYFTAEEVLAMIEDAESFGDIAYRFNQAAEERSRNPEKNITGRDSDVLKIIEQYGMIDGAHHKQWLLDQIVRAIYRDTEGYKSWVKNFNDPNYEPWDRGIAP